MERAIVNTANLLNSKGHQVTIIVLDETNESFFPLQDGVGFLQYNLKFGITEQGNILSRKFDSLRDIKKLTKILFQLKPHIIIGTEYPLTIAGYLAGHKTGAKIFAWEHHHFHWLKKSWFWNYLFKKIYPRLTSVICLNDTEQILFQKLGCKTTVIPNFVIQQARALLNQKNILSIGWLINRKGVDRVPEIAQKIFDKYRDWTWTIIGAGEEEIPLRNEIAKRQLEKHVLIVAPDSSNLGPAYLNASVYVMTSRFECFPMVLLEAKSHGLPAVAYDCPTGPAFIIQNQVDGLLVEPGDAIAMAESIINLLDNEEKRRSFGSAAYENINRFSPGAAYILWEKLLTDTK